MDRRGKHPAERYEYFVRPLGIRQFSAGSVRIIEVGPHFSQVHFAESRTILLLDLNQRSDTAGGLIGFLGIGPADGRNQTVGFVTKLCAHVRNLFVDGLHRHARGHQVRHIMLYERTQDTAADNDEEQHHEKLGQRAPECEPTMEKNQQQA